MSIQIGELTKKVSLLATKGTLNKEACGVCSNYVHDAKICLFQRETIIGPKQVNEMEVCQPRLRMALMQTLTIKEGEIIPIFIGE